MSNSLGGNRGCLGTPARTSGLSSTKGMVREGSVKVSYSQFYSYTNDNSSNRVVTTKYHQITFVWKKETPIGKNILGAQNMCGGRDSAGWGRDRVGGHKYTPLYENGTKKTQNKLMETTEILHKK